MQNLLPKIRLFDNFMVEWKLFMDFGSALSVSNYCFQSVILTVSSFIEFHSCKYLVVVVSLFVYL